MNAPVALGPFIWRRIHSLTGFWIVLFLFEHLLVNSQAALWLGDSGREFVVLVNWIHDLPYLQVVEATLIGIPILVHMVWGIKYLFTAKYNSLPTTGRTPALHKLSRNQAYTWQRITSWILVVGIILHVAKFRFIDYPAALHQGAKSTYFVLLDMDRGLYTVAPRLNVSLYDAKAIDAEVSELKARSAELELLESAKFLKEAGGFPPKAIEYEPQKAWLLETAQKLQQKVDVVQMLQRLHPSEGEVVAVCPTFGTASLLTVRDTFKHPIYSALYTLFVLAACYHGLNGFWTFLITWGLLVRYAAQKSMVNVNTFLMCVLIFLGLLSIWGTYLSNLRT